MFIIRLRQAPPEYGSHNRSISSPSYRKSMDPPPVMKRSTPSSSSVSHRHSFASRTTSSYQPSSRGATTHSFASRGRQVGTFRKIGSSFGGGNRGKRRQPVVLIRRPKEEPRRNIR